MVPPLLHEQADDALQPIADEVAANLQALLAPPPELRPGGTRRGNVLFPAKQRPLHVKQPPTCTLSSRRRRSCTLEVPEQAGAPARTGLWVRGICQFHQHERVRWIGSHWSRLTTEQLWQHARPPRAGQAVGGKVVRKPHVQAQLAQIVHQRRQAGRGKAGRTG